MEGLPFSGASPIHPVYCSKRYRASLPYRRNSESRLIVLAIVPTDVSRSEGLIP
jgi:hypothetical protein